MAYGNNDFMEMVFADIKKYDGIRRPVKASVLERALKKSISPMKLHPNPEDEFSMESVGPNFNIIGKYASQINELQLHGEKVFEEPVMVEKMSPDGYMLINGHHRWAAAVTRKVKKINIKIVNITNLDYIYRVLDKSQNDKSISIDLDEVLWVKDDGAPTEKMKYLASKRYKEKLRLGAPNLIHSLQKKGYDIWVYTSAFLPTEYIERYFRKFGIKLNGIINCFGNEKTKNIADDAELKEKIRKKYKLSCNIDSKYVFYLGSSNEQYDMIDLECEADRWSDTVNGIICDIEKKMGL